MAIVFEIYNDTATQLQIGSIMVHNNGWYQVAGGDTPIKNDVNSGFYLIKAPLTIEPNQSVRVQTMFNTFVLYKNGLTSDSAFLLFNVRQSNLHIGLKGEALRHTGVYGDNPGSVTWEYQPSEAHLAQVIRIARVQTS